MKWSFRQILSGLSVALLIYPVTQVFAHQSGEIADVVYQNGKIVTMEDSGTIAESIAISGNRIIDVGSNNEVAFHIDKNTRIVDLKGKTVVPGLIDTHLHFMRYGLKFLQIECMNKSKEEILASVEKQAGVLPTGSWIRGNGWNQTIWTVAEFPTAAELDKVSGDFPVVLIRSDNHATWVNQKALDIAGITRETPDPDGGKILRDANGNPTGILIDSAMKLVNSKMPAWSEEEMKRAYLLADQSYSQYGLTTIHDAGDIANIPLIKSLIRDEKINTRIYEVLDQETGIAYLEKGIKPEVGLYNDHLTIRAIKYKVDGALGSRGARMLEDYSDAPGVRGNTLIKPERLTELAQKSFDLGYQASTHAIGDETDKQVLDIYENLFRKNDVKDNSIRFNIVHAQVLTPSDLPRFAELKIPALMQPIHATGDMNMAEDRVGPVRILGAYAWRSLTDSGALIAGGSDSPNDYLSPVYGIHAAVTRQDQKNRPPGGWYPQERLTRVEALALYTKNAAYISFEEKTKGTLEIGKYADFIVLSDDILTMPAEDIWKTKVLLTVIGGKEVYINNEK